MSSLRAVLFVDIFPPSMGGGATRALRLVQGMIALGWMVTVVTTSSNYPVSNSILSLKHTEEQRENLKIIRVPSLNLPFKGYLNRLLNYSVFCFSLLLFAPQIKKVDLIFSLGMHPFSDLAAYLTKINNSGSRLIIDISDLLPESSFFKVYGQILNRFLISLSDKIVLHNERMKKVFELKYENSKQMFVIPNAVDTSFFKPDSLSHKSKSFISFISGRDLRNYFVICYFGVLGPFQGIPRIVEAASILQSEFGSIFFLIIGEGEEKTKIKQLSHSLNNVCLVPKLSREQIAQVSAEVDLGLVPLISADPLLVYVNLPSKAAEFLSSGVPILTAEDTFIGNLVSKWNAGYEVNFNDISEICDSIRHIYANKSKLTIKSQNARQVAVSFFSLNTVKERLKELKSL